MSNKISYSKARGLLASLWTVGFLIPSAILIIQSINGTKYEEKVAEVWAWFIPTVVPTFTLIVGVLVADHQGKRTNIKYVSSLLFWISFVLATFYLLSVLGLIIFMQPSSMSGSSGGLTSLKVSSIYLGVFQGLITAAFGAFFVNKGDSA